MVVPLGATAAEVAARLSLFTSAAERVAQGCPLSLAACWSWLLKAVVLLYSY